MASRQATATAAVYEGNGCAERRIQTPKEPLRVRTFELWRRWASHAQTAVQWRVAHRAARPSDPGCVNAIIPVFVESEAYGHEAVKAL